MVPQRNGFLKLFWRVHRWIFKATRGRVGTRVRGMPILLLMTTGRKSGLPRENALMYGLHGDGYVVIASNAGAGFHPAWWLNLEAQPKATVMVAGKLIPVRAREAQGDERRQLWDQLAGELADYEVYRERTDRHIPVVVLEPAETN